jgi:predicted deacylase
MDDRAKTTTDAFTIGDISANKGEMARGFLTLGETVSGPIQIPLVVMNGAGDGPELCITAGVHATEYAPIDAAMRLIHQVDPKKLRGRLVVIPVMNMPMFQARMPFVSPVDGLNLNKIAPGSKDGTISEILAHTLLEEVLAEADYHIDLHAGDFGEQLWAFAGYALSGDHRQDIEGEALTRVYSPRMIVLSREGGTVPPFPGSLNHSASKRGIISILAEAGGDGTLNDADVQEHLNGIWNVMKYLKMVDGEPHVAGPRIRGTDRFVMRARRSGLVRLTVAIGDNIAEGQIVAEICNVFGEVIETIRAPRPGIAGLIWSHKVVNIGDPVVRCWVTEPASPFPATDKFVQLNETNSC